MPFDIETAREAGKKSKRGKGRISLELKELIAKMVDGLIEEMNYSELTTDQKIKLIQVGLD